MKNIKEERLIATLNGYESLIHSLAISDKNSILASGACNGIIKLWDIKMY